MDVKDNKRKIVMVNGLPGKMATEVAKRIVASEDFYLWHYALTGPETKEDKVAIDKERISLYRPDQRVFFKVDSYFPEEGLVVDFSLPSAVNYNADYYCSHRMNFVMGTTGGDRIALEARVRDSDIVAVVAPNMAKQIVALQAMFAYAANTFPGAFEGYTLEVEESHQAGKKDTSGTAKAMVAYFNTLGVPFAVEDIRRFRDPVVQEHLMGVPKEHLGGTLDALKFLQRKVEAGEKGKVYSMIDVLRGE